MRAVFKMPGSRSGDTAASCSAVSITAYGAQGTPQATKCAFSRARSCATDTALAAGDTGRCAARAAERGSGHVFKLGGHRIGHAGQLGQAWWVFVAGLNVVGGSPARRGWSGRHRAPR